MDINYLFIAVIVLFLYMIIRGYTKGFLRIAVTFLGMIVILMAVKRITPYVSEYIINNTGAYTSVKEKITERFEQANSQYDNTIQTNQELTINSYDLPDLLKNKLIINNTKEMYKILVVELFEEYVSAYLAKTAVKAMAFVILFVVFIVAFKILLSVVDLISRIPIIKGINKTAGALLGLIESLLITWVFFIIVVMFMGNESGYSLIAMISESKFLSFLFNSNILMQAF